MDSLNDDCLVSILSNLPVDDLNTVAMCNRRFRDARSSDSLDQTRTGTIILSGGSTALSLFNAIVENNWNAVFSGNRKKLKLWESSLSAICEPPFPSRRAGRECATPWSHYSRCFNRTQWPDQPYGLGASNLLHISELERTGHE